MQTINLYSSSYCSCCKVVRYSSQIFTKSLRHEDCQQLDSITGIMKAFTAMLNCLQANNPLSAKIRHFAWLFSTTLPYSTSITESTIKKGGATSAPFYIVCVYFSMVF